jgi:hypothetical protein
MLPWHGPPRSAACARPSRPISRAAWLSISGRGAAWGRRGRGPPAAALQALNKAGGVPFSPADERHLRLFGAHLGNTLVKAKLAETAKCAWGGEGQRPRGGARERVRPGAAGQAGCPRCVWVRAEPL